MFDYILITITPWNVSRRGYLKAKKKKKKLFEPVRVWRRKTRVGRRQPTEGTEKKLWSEDSPGSSSRTRQKLVTGRLKDWDIFDPPGATESWMSTTGRGRP